MCVSSCVINSSNNIILHEINSSYIIPIPQFLSPLEAKETYKRDKKDLLKRQNRPTKEAKETYERGKTDLLEGRPTKEAKDT